MSPCILVLSAAVALDLVLGDPVYRLHPVRLLGNLIMALESAFRRWGLDGIFGGALFVLVFVITVTITALAAHFALWKLNPLIGIGFDIFALYSSICLGDLVRHGKRVAKALEKGDLASSRAAVRFIVGRDVDVLDFHGVGRAAVESVAESYVDAFLSPVFWYSAGCLLLSGFSGVSPLAGGVAAVVIFRAVNTLDSMVGYKNERYLYFGRPAARLDDVLNFLPARLSIPIIAISALINGMDGQNALGVGLRDRGKHPSPNSAHAESAVAGALNIRLGGPGYYEGKPSEKPWLGDGTDWVTHRHLRKCIRLVRLAGLGAVLAAAGLLVRTA